VFTEGNAQKTTEISAPFAQIQQYCFIFNAF
jgi:hypothetical protein